MADAQQRTRRGPAKAEKAEPKAKPKAEPKAEPTVHPANAQLVDELAITMSEVSVAIAPAHSSVCAVQ